MSSISEDVDDRLSMLPEDILSHILSLMPTKFAVRTSVLSKRWRYICMSVTNLDLGDIYHVDNLHGWTKFVYKLHSLTKFVDRVLKFCTPSQVKLFRLHFPLYCAPQLSVSIWIDELVRLKISELDLRVPHHQLPPSMFTCKTLTKLRLDCSGYDYYNNVWELKCEINLPCLKTLDIVVCDNRFVDAYKLISGCPMLENLYLEVTWFQGEKDYVFNIPTLQRFKLTLTLAGCITHINKVILKLPKLEYLFVGGDLSSTFVAEDVSSLVEACFTFGEIRSYHLLFELLRGIKGVKSLSAQNVGSLIRFNMPFAPPLPIFPDMKHLELNGYWPSVLIPQFLESSPQLKHLCIENAVDPYIMKHGEYRWVEPKFVPSCVVTKLTTIKFLIDKSWKCDIPFLKYMLGNAEALKTITITCRYGIGEDEEKRLRAKLLKLLPRATSHPEIHFHGNWTHSTIMQ